MAVIKLSRIINFSPTFPPVAVSAKYQIGPNNYLFGISSCPSEILALETDSYDTIIAAGYTYCRVLVDVSGLLKETE